MILNGHAAVDRIEGGEVHALQVVVGVQVQVRAHRRQRREVDVGEGVVVVDAQLVIDDHKGGEIDGGRERVLDLDVAGGLCQAAEIDGIGAGGVDVDITSLREAAAAEQGGIVVAEDGQICGIDRLAFLLGELAPLCAAVALLGLIDLAVAVVVDLVAQLRRSGLHLGGDVIAVIGVADVAAGLAACGRGVGVGTVAVAVVVDVPLGAVGQGWIALVAPAVAVVVDAIADLCCAWVDGAVIVVAVLTHSRRALGGLAAILQALRQPVAVAVGVGVPGHEQSLVGAAVAVVVDPITHLLGVW